MPVEIIITGDTAAHSIAELREFAAPFYAPIHVGEAREVDALTDDVRAKATAALVDATIDDAPKTNALLAQAVAEAPKPATRARKAKGTPAPVVQEDPPEVQAQDAADEAAEVAAAAPAEPARVYTYEDVRAALSGYVKKYGLPAVQEDGLKIYESIQPGAKKVSDFPADSAVLAKVVAAVEKVIAENPYNRPTVGA